MIWIIPPPFSAVTQRPGCKRGSWPFCSDTEKPAHTANSLPSVTFYSHKYISPFSNLTPLSPCAQGFVSLPPSLPQPPAVSLLQATQVKPPLELLWRGVRGGGCALSQSGVSAAAYVSRATRGGAASSQSEPRTGSVSVGHGGEDVSRELMWNRDSVAMLFKSTQGEKHHRTNLV